MRFKKVAYSYEFLWVILSLFFILNCAFQYTLFKSVLLNPYSNGDESGYFYLINSKPKFSIQAISGYTAQPYTFLGLVLNFLFDNAKYTNRFISLFSGILLFLFLYKYYLKNKFINFIPNNEKLNKFILVNIFFSVLFIMPNHYIGTSDLISVAFGISGFILFNEVLLNQKEGKPWIIGLLFALSFTSRPIFIIILFTYLFSFFVQFKKQILCKFIISVGIFFILFVGIINFQPIMNNRGIILDLKEIPKDQDTSWFEMNYLMAKKKDSGEIPNDKWITSQEVIEFKRKNPNFIFPKNHLDILIKDTGLFFRQMIRMSVISMYSSFRYMYLLFPFLIFFPFFKKFRQDKNDLRIAYFILLFYFSSLIILMIYAFKAMEFRWMYMPILFFTFYSLDLIKKISFDKRILFFNGFFVLGVLFFIVKIIKG